MKYLYPYECEKRRLSTPSELQAAIDGNRREGRRSSYGTYPELMQRSPGPTHPSQMSPLSLASQLRPQMNGNGHLHHPVLHPSLGQPPLPGKFFIYLFLYIFSSGVENARNKLKILMNFKVS